MNQEGGGLAATKEGGLAAPKEGGLAAPKEGGDRYESSTRPRAA
jgi:hypothetical protein